MKMNKKLVKEALFIKIKRGLSKLKRLKGKPPKTNEYTEFEKSEYKIPLEEKPDLNIYIYQPSTDPQLHSTDKDIAIINLKKIISLKERLRAIHVKKKRRPRLNKKIKRKDDIISYLKRRV